MPDLPADNAVTMHRRGWYSIEIILADSTDGYQAHQGFLVVRSY
jgi:hypothetical protein